MTDDIPAQETLANRHGSDLTPVGSGPPAHAGPGAPVLREIGPYKLLDVLGEGAMGYVYLAQQEKPFHRRVAIKIIKPGMDTKQVMARFEAEREMLALMNHPNVARVFDAGATETGRPYFVMEYVPGIPITDYSDKHRLNTEERLQLFMDVCHAVQHAHQKGIIHRDIKPSNVLVYVTDEKPIVKVIDFGVAKATQHRLTEKTLYTEHGQLIGTPGYMSPEQAEMTALDIDTRTDIYSLGVLLYELLVGALPFDAKTLLQGGYAEIQRIIREVDPPKPSTRLSALAEAGTKAQRHEGTEGMAPKRQSDDASQATGAVPRGSEIETIAHRRHTEPKTLIRQLRGDLDWIIMRAMEKDRFRRYDTANGLAMEIQRFLNNEPVLAGPPSARYRLSKFVRRNRASVCATAVIFLAILTGTVVSTRMYVRAEAARSETVLERDRALTAEVEAHARRSEAEAVLRFLGQMIEMFDPAKSLGRDVTVRELLDRRVSKIQDAFKDQPIVEAHLRSMFGEAYRSLGEYELAEQHIRKALELRRTRLGEKHSAVAVTMLELGKVLFEKGDYKNADSFIVQGNGLLLGHRSGVDSLNIEAAAAMSRGDFRRSATLYRKDLEARRARLGPNHVEVGDALYNLGVLLCRMEAFDEAERMYRDALEIRRRHLPHDHPDFAYSLLALGDLLVKTKRSAEAESILREALQISRKVLPQEHWQIPLTEATLGECLTALGRFGEAESLLLASYPEIIRVQGVDNLLYTADALKAIINLYELWDAAEPEKGYAETAAEWRKKIEETSKNQNPGAPGPTLRSGAETPNP